MKLNALCKTVALAALMTMGAAQAQEVVRLGNLKFAHYGAVSYIKEIAPKCGIKVDEHVFAKGLDVMQAIIAGRAFRPVRPCSDGMSLFTSAGEKTCVSSKLATCSRSVTTSLLKGSSGVAVKSWPSSMV